MSKKTTKSTKATRPRARRARAKKVVMARFVCRNCNSEGRGGYFNAANDKGTKCPYCSSTGVKLLG